MYTSNALSIKQYISKRTLRVTSGRLWEGQGGVFSARAVHSTLDAATVKSFTARARVCRSFCRLFQLFIIYMVCYNIQVH